MISVHLDVSPFIAYGQSLEEGAVKQVPFVLSRLLNDSAFKAKQVLVESTWPRHVQVYNKQFLNYALRVERSTKQNLTVRVYDAVGRANLEQHAVGGVARPFKARKLAVPLFAARRGPRGIYKVDSPAGIIQRTPKRALRVTTRGIFVAEGGRLHMKYSFQPSVNIRPTVPFYQDFAYVVQANMSTGFDDAMAEALRTTRVRALRREAFS